MSDDAGNEGYDEWLDAVADGEAFYLECPEGHGSLPPRRVCPECGSRELVETDLPETGEVETFTETHVATPSFDADAPYVIGIASFGPVRITGQIRNLDSEDVEPGIEVALDVDERETTDDRLVVLRPV